MIKIAYTKYNSVDRALPWVVTPPKRFCEIQRLEFYFQDGINPLDVHPLTNQLNQKCHLFSIKGGVIFLLETPLAIQGGVPEGCIILL